MIAVPFNYLHVVIEMVPLIVWSGFCRNRDSGFYRRVTADERIKYGIIDKAEHLDQPSWQLVGIHGAMLAADLRGATPRSRPVRSLPSLSASVGDETRPSRSGNSADRHPGCPQ